MAFYSPRKTCETMAIIEKLSLSLSLPLCISFLLASNGLYFGVLFFFLFSALLVLFYHDKFVGLQVMHSGNAYMGSFFMFIEFNSCTIYTNVCFDFLSSPSTLLSHSCFLFSDILTNTHKFSPKRIV